ncbi:MAG: putative ABC transporter permease [Coriobacteriales bacterium]|jgi:uncharacterized membrane protein|nr:putative ABC transporter permease [Coriobacteriales bacterium]
MEAPAKKRQVRAWQRYFYYFIIGAIMGQVYEILLDNLWYHHPWHWQGPLHGPWLIIYGVGGVVLLMLLERLLDKPIKVGKLNLMPLVIAILIFLIAGVVEYAGHWLLDTFFDFRPWDYSAKPFNINGRVCLEDTLRFVVLGMAGLYLVRPPLEKFLDRISKRANLILCTIVVGAFTLDVVVSLGIMLLT